jgi:GH25 family lysozyme M1 (1,4-beta-N-acetylmuramidase)
MIIKNPPCYDISHWKEVADFNAISPRPVLMITKATEGISIQDSKFIRFFDGMKRAGYHRGAYHFFRKSHSAVAQAQYFIDFITPHIDDNTILILDMEEGGESTSQVLVWFDYVRVAFPRNRLLFYSRRNLLEALIMSTAQKEAFCRIPVWVAGYPNDPDLYDAIPNFYIPDPLRFGPTVLWQYSAHGAVTGIEGDVDLNWISPTYQQILGDVQPPTEGTTMALYTGTAKLTATPNVRVRRTYPDGMTIGAIQPGQSFEGDRLENGWMHVIKVGSSLIDGWSSAQYLTYTETPTDPEPPADPDTVAVDIEMDVTATFNGSQYHGVIAFGNVQLQKVA